MTEAEKIYIFTLQETDPNRYQYGKGFVKIPDDSHRMTAQQWELLRKLETFLKIKPNENH